MKKITFIFLIFLWSTFNSSAQISVGNETQTDQQIPIEPWYGYSYSQIIYLATEINSSGAISGITYYGTPGLNLSSSSDWTVYIGATTKTSFDNDTDWIDVNTLTQVFNGTVSVSNDTVTITFDNTFNYDGSSNLVIAVDENQPSYDTSGNDFYTTSVSSDRSIFYRNDNNNPDPSNPPAASNVVSYIANIQFLGITQTCPTLSNLNISNIGASSADFTWDTTSDAVSYEYINQLSETADPTIGDDTTTDTTVSITGLSPNTEYTFWVRANCSNNENSSWSSITYNTSCVASDYFVEDFEATSVGTVTNCWSFITESTSSFATVGANDSNDPIGSMHMRLYNSGDADATLILTSPELTDNFSLSQLKFMARDNNQSTIVIGTMSDRTDANSFTAFETITLSNDYTQYIVSLENYTGSDNIIAFKQESTSTYSSTYIDNVNWEAIPASAPDCTTNFSNNANTNCGNYSFSISWDAVSGAEGYRINVGTTSGGTDIIADEDLGAITSVSLDNPNAGTTYYYTVIPYNTNGNASACSEETVTTSTTGCYCDDIPSSNDGNGIQSVNLEGVTLTSGGDLTYEDFTSTPIDINQGTLNNMNVVFDTGYSYDTFVFIDINDDFIFDTITELFYTGESTNDTPATLDTSFVLSATAATGEHRMRIVSADNLSSPDPCYSGSYGVTVDITVNVIIPQGCLPVTDLSIDATTSSSASASWTASNNAQTYEYAVLSPTDPEPTAGQETTSDTTISLSGLSDNTEYVLWVRSNCANDDSIWLSVTFTTPCNAFAYFTENFESVTTPETPDCWYSIVNSTSSFAAVETNSNNALDANSMSFYNSSDTNAELLLISPNLADDLSLSQVKFSGEDGDGNNILVGTISDPNDANTFTLHETVALTDNFTSYTVTFDNYSGTDTYVALKMEPTGTYQYTFIDNFEWEAIPSTAPNCINNYTTDEDANCGNYDFTISWDPVSGVNGYKLYAGTTSGANDIEDGLDIGNVASFLITAPNYNTTYYYTIVPYNTFGDATGCQEQTVTTANDGCYCTDIPSSNDGTGISQVELGSDIFTSAGDVTYEDFTATPVEVMQNSTANLQITFATGYTYTTYAFIDFNDDFNFDTTSELVFSGESTNSNPTVLDASFLLAADAPIGTHRLRIVGTDNDISPNPCYSGTYGVIADMEITITEEGLSIADYNFIALDYYPNPVENSFYLSAPEKIETIRVFNMLGQEIISKKVEAKQDTIDFSSLPTGSYFVKVTTEDASKTVRVIKI